MSDTGTQFQDRTIYKKWHLTGFISVDFWEDGGKAIIDIGETEKGSKAFKGHTSCYVDAVRFLVYLENMVNQGQLRLFQDNKFEVFGGSRDKNTNKVVARVFKAEHPKNKETGADDMSRVVFKCGHFAGSETDQGAIKPDYKNVISVHFTYMKYTDIAELAAVLRFKIQAAFDRGNEEKLLLK